MNCKIFTIHNILLNCIERNMHLMEITTALQVSTYRQSWAYTTFLQKTSKVFGNTCRMLIVIQLWLLNTWPVCILHIVQTQYQNKMMYRW